MRSSAVIALAAGLAVAVAAVLVMSPSHVPGAGVVLSRDTGTRADAGAPTRAPATPAAGRAEPSAVPASVAASESTPWSARARAVQADLAQLAGLPPGDAAIALASRLEADADGETAPAFRAALRTTSDAGVERTAIAALARTSDAATMAAMADDYGSMAPELRGRVLQVLEGARNPAALDGLMQIVAADTSEKRPPLVMSALYGAASLSTMESVGYLVAQVANPANQDLALMALERVHTRQGIELIRAASQGSKDAEALPDGLRDALARIARRADDSGIAQR